MLACLHKDIYCLVMAGLKSSQVYKKMHNIVVMYVKGIPKVFGLSG